MTDLKNNIYRKVVTPSGDALDGETATIITLTEEMNCFVLWLEGFDYSIQPLRIFALTERDEAIEKAVYLGGFSERQLAEQILIPAWRHSHPDLDIVPNSDVTGVGT